MSLSSFNSEAARVFLDEGRIPEVGSTFKNPDLAQTMHLIARHGSDVFYYGEIAEAIEKGTGGWIDRKSLEAYEAIERDVLRGTYGDFEILSVPPVSGGVRVLQTLNILEAFDLSSFASITEPRVVHLMAEALKQTHVDYLAHVWDPDFYELPIQGLVSKQYAKELARRISSKRARRPTAGNPYKLSSPIA